MPSKSYFPETYIFSTNFCKFCLFFALCVFAATCLKPSKNYGFVILRTFQRCVGVGAETLEKTSQKPIEKPSETTSEPLENRCQKCVVFRHQFFRVLASNSEGLGLLRWSQVGSVSFQNLRIVPPKNPLKLDAL